ncbi:phage holin family protein [Haloferula sp.]|uniref:phage holin family protein n=1 Tax=Haloferula sp. TaxID=2497595 RepID=UPI003C77F553
MSDDAPESPPHQNPQDEGWAAAATTFITARIDLLKYEARDAGQEALKRGALLALILFCAIFFWCLLTVGLIGWISMSQDWPWYAVTLVFAGLYLLTAIIAGVLLKKPTAPPFPLTRAELSKDQAWLETLKNDPKSQN